MNAQEAKLAAETVLKSHADKVYKKIEQAANNGHFYIHVETSTINDQVKNMLTEDGFKVEYKSGRPDDRFSTAEYKISWK
jgi:hypothetical protein